MSRTGDGRLPSPFVARRGVRWLALVCWILLGIALLRMTPLGDWIHDFQAFKSWLRGFGIWSPIVFALATSALVSLGAPRLIFFGVGGAAFGFVEGFVFAQLGSLAGAYATFVLVRRLGLTASQTVEVATTRQKVHALIHRHAFWGVIVARQLPVTGAILNTAFALTTMSHATFLAASFIAFVPEGALAALAGSGAGKASWERAALSLIGGLLLLGVLYVVHGRLAKRAAARA